MIEIFENLKKYNPWGGNSLKTGYRRQDELKRIMPSFGNRLIKVIVGQRRSGKSYLLRQIMEELIEKGTDPESLLYLNKEYVDFDAIKSPRDLHELVRFARKQLKIKKKMTLFIDEVQEIEGWEKIINSLAQDFSQEYEVVITGSNSTMMAGELASLLTGRYISFEVFPFSFAEYADYLKLEKKKETFLAYLKTSGLPEFFHLKDEELRRNYISSLKDTILLRDIMRKFQVRDEPLLERLFLFLADNIGNLFSLHAITQYLKSQGFKTSHETLSQYIRLLRQSFVCHEVERYDLKGKRIFSSQKKYYLNDLAFRNYLASGFDEGLGKHLENALYLHYRRKGYHVSVGVMGGNEVDFILEKGKEKKYVQVAYSIAEERVANREFRPLLEIKDHYPKSVVTLDDLSFGQIEGIPHLCAWELE